MWSITFIFRFVCPFAHNFLISNGVRMAIWVEHCRGVFLFHNCVLSDVSTKSRPVLASPSSLWQWLFIPVTKEICGPTCIVWLLCDISESQTSPGGNHLIDALLIEEMKTKPGDMDGQAFFQCLKKLPLFVLHTDRAPGFQSSRLHGAGFSGGVATEDVSICMGNHGCPRCAAGLPLAKPALFFRMIRWGFGLWADTRLWYLFQLQCLLIPFLLCSPRSIAGVQLYETWFLAGN